MYIEGIAKEYHDVSAVMIATDCSVNNTIVVQLKRIYMSVRIYTSVSPSIITERWCSIKYRSSSSIYCLLLLLCFIIKNES